MSSKSLRPATPRLSASLILIDSLNRVLLVQRNPKSTSFGNFHVFPGGNFDKAQDTSPQSTAIRETFEETGILLAQNSSAPSGHIPPNDVLDVARFAIHSQKLLFTDFLQQHSLISTEDSLLPFTQWITPASVPRRFHTHFFLALAGQHLASADSSSTEQRLPTPDGGLEVIATSFQRPQDWISAFEKGEIFLMPPQYYLLVTLAEVISGNKMTADQTTRLATLSRGNFGNIVIHPTSKSASGGGSFMLYEGDEEHGGPQGRKHRARLEFGKGNMISGIKMERNFDIFSEYPTNSSPNSKL